MQVIIVCLTAVFRCGSFCSFGFSYLAKIINLACYVYGVPVLLQIQVFMEIAFSLSRINPLKYTNTTQARKEMKFRYKLTISLVVSLIVAFPKAFPNLYIIYYIKKNSFCFIKILLFSLLNIIIVNKYICEKFILLFLFLYEKFYFGFLI